MYFWGSRTQELRDGEEDRDDEPRPQKGRLLPGPDVDGATWSFFRTMGHKIGTPLWLKASAMIWVTQPTLKPSSSSGTTAMPWAFRPIISRVSRTGKSRVCVSPRWRKRWEIIRSFWPRVEFFRSTSGA